MASRKKLKARYTNDHPTTGDEAAILAARAHNFDAGPDRRAFLEQWASTSLDVDRTTTLRPHVVKIVLATAFESMERDVTRLQTAYRAAHFYLTTHDELVWREALSPRVFVAYEATRPDLASTTLGDYLSLQRRLLREAGLTEGAPGRKHPRSATKPPYTKTEKENFLKGAQLLSRLHRREYEILWTLTFCAGLSTDELTRMRWGWVVPDGDHVIVQVVNRHGVVRDVPLAPPHADRLVQYRGEVDEFVVARSRARKDALYAMMRDCFERNPDLSIEWSRARNTFIVDLLQSELPFATVAYVCDLGAGNHTTVDLVKYCDRRTEQDHISLLMKVI